MLRALLYGEEIYPRFHPRDQEKEILKVLKGEAKISEARMGTKDYIQRNSKELAKFVIRISLKKPEDYKPEHRRLSAEFFTKKWNLPLGESFDAVVIEGDKETKPSLKPWATSRREQWKLIMPLDRYKSKNLNIEWYDLQAKAILDRLFPKEQQASLEFFSH